MERIQIFFLSLFCLINIGWVSQEPSKLQDRLNKGYQAWQQGNLTEALNYYQDALMLEPRQVDVMNTIGAIYEQLGWPQKAEMKYLTAIRIKKTYLPSYYNLGLFYWNQGQTQKAMDYLQKRIDLGDPKDTWTIKARRYLEDIKSNRKMELEKAIEQFELPNSVQGASLQSNHRDQRVVNQDLDNLENKKQGKDLVVSQVLDQVSQQKPSNQPFFHNGQELASQGRYEEAIAEYDKALKITPGVPQIIKARVEAFMNLKQHSNNWR
ncbi:MAG: tetratricopeptide repeat protein [Candidatus Omnitrophica bacterium]|nr:tetratricopeptide repeat protein [Candidatus Omnitrophota bacterium]